MYNNFNLKEPKYMTNTTIKFKVKKMNPKIFIQLDWT